MDKSLFNECKTNLESSKRKRQAMEDERIKKWQDLNDTFGGDDL